MKSFGCVAYGVTHAHGRIGLRLRIALHPTEAVRCSLAQQAVEAGSWALSRLMDSFYWRGVSRAKDHRDSGLVVGFLAVERKSNADPHTGLLLMILGEGVMGSQSSPSSHAGSAKLYPSPAGRLNILAAPPPPWILGMCPFALAIPRVGRHIGFLNLAHFHSP